MSWLDDAGKAFKDFFMGPPVPTKPTQPVVPTLGLPGSQPIKASDVGKNLPNVTDVLPGPRLSTDAALKRGEQVKVTQTPVQTSQKTALQRSVATSNAQIQAQNAAQIANRPKPKDLAAIGNVTKDVLQLLPRTTTSLALSAANKDSDITPNGAFQKFFLGEEKVQPMAKTAMQVSDFAVKIAKSMETPEQQKKNDFASNLARFPVVGAAALAFGGIEALNVDPMAGLVNGLKKKLIKGIGDDIVHTVIRNEMETVLRQSGRTIVDEVAFNKGLDAIAGHAASQSTLAGKIETARANTQKVMDALAPKKGVGAMPEVPQIAPSKPTPTNAADAFDDFFGAPPEKPTIAARRDAVTTKLEGKAAAQNIALPGMSQADVLASNAYSSAEREAAYQKFSAATSRSPAYLDSEDMGQFVERYAKNTKQPLADVQNQFGGSHVVGTYNEEGAMSNDELFDQFKSRFKNEQEIKATFQKANVKLTPAEQAIEKSGGIGPEYTGTPHTPVAPNFLKPTEVINPESALDEAMKITQTKPTKQSLGSKVKAGANLTYDALVAEFEPLARAEKTLLGSSPDLTMAKRFELHAGAGGIAETDLKVFEDRVLGLVRKQQEDFNAYLFLKRAEDRLVMDAEARAVGEWTAEKARAGLQALQNKLGAERYAEFERIGQAYQEVMDESLKLQVSSGRLSQEMYDKIKGMNDFYAPYKVLHYIEGGELAMTKEGISGSGRNIATTEDLTKAIKGISSEEFGVADILHESAKQIYKSRILAEKNLKMLKLAELARVDKTGEFFKAAKPTRYFRIEYKPAEAVLHQLAMQGYAMNPQLLEQQMIKVGKAIQFADEVGITVVQKNMRSSLGRATLGGIDRGGTVKLKAFISDTIAHELAHIFDTKTGEIVTKKVFGKMRDIELRLSSFINGTGFKGEMKRLINFTAPNSPDAWKSKAVEKFAEFVQLYIHDPAKARELAPNFTDFFELKLLPENKIKALVERLAEFYQKVDNLPNIRTPLKEMDDNSYLDTAIRRAFPDRKPQTGVSFGTKPREGYKIVEYLANGTVKALEVRNDIARAIQGLNTQQVGLVAKFLGFAAGPFRIGATAGNIGFQLVNALIYDPARLLKMSRYGFKNPTDIIRFPLDWIHGVSTSFFGGVGGGKSDLYTAWLKSGAVNSTIQRSLTPEAFSHTLGKKAVSIKQPLQYLASKSRWVLDSVAKLANALEEGTKITALKRGLRMEGVAVTDVGKPAVTEKVARVASEVRNYGGSPDFGRHGNTTKDTNLIFMFFNARMQGIESDIRRMAGGTGRKDQRAAWMKYLATTGIAATYLAIANRSPENKADYDKRPQYERDNNFLIPRDSYTTTSDGEKVRDYWKIPKREFDQYLSNVMDSFFDFAYDKDPTAFQEAAMSVIEGMSPVSISGRNMQERTESVFSSTNPLIKAPLEFATGRDTFRHRDVIPQNLKNVKPSEQYTKTTNPLYVKAGQATGLSPLKLQTLSRGLFAGGIDQFFPNAPEGERSAASTLPGVSRFYSAPYTDSAGFWDKINAARENTATEGMLRTREAERIYSSLRGKSLDEQNALLKQAYDKDERLYEKVIDVADDAQKGIGSEERAMKSLAVQNGERARFIVQYLKDQTDFMMDPTERLQEQNRLLEKLYNQKVVTDEVMGQLQQLQAAR